jgi:S-DNA-T family DNA segregation ATPase FtsK/SpoIIIE
MATATSDSKSTKRSRKTAKKGRKASERPSLGARMANLRQGLMDPRFRKVLGLGFVLIGIFMAVAMGSYLVHFDVDQDQVHGRGIGMVFDGDAEVRNALGRLGAWTAHQLMDLRFGLTAFLLAFCSLALGANLLYGKRMFVLRKVFGYSALAILWGSTALAFLTGPHSDLPGGGLGRFIADGLSGALGSVGTGILLGFAFLAFVVLQFNPEWNLPQWLTDRSASRMNGDLEDNSDASDGHPSQSTDALLERQAPTYHSVDELNGEGKKVRQEESILKPKSKRTPEDPDGLELEVVAPSPAGAASDQAGTNAAANGKEDYSLASPSESSTDAGSGHPAGHASGSTQSEREAVGVDETQGTPGSAVQSGTEADASKASDGWTAAPGAAKTAAQSGDSPELDIADPVVEKIEAERGSLESNYDPTLELPDYRYPTLELLEDYGHSDVTVNTEELERNKDQIIETLDNYGIQISKIKATPGPTVTLYEIVPAKGVRISKIKNLEDDIALSLSALGIRIIAPIPGKGTVGIEVPNVNKTIVGMKGQLGSEKFTKAKMALPICLGKTISGENYVADLARMPHLLMAGATGQGKSVGINAILVSLLYKKHPSELKLVLVDPKKVELSLFQLIEKHFLATMPGEEESIITDVRKVVKSLNALCIEMDQRYDLLKKAHTRNITEYNGKFLKRKLNPNNGHRYLPFIVLVIDEFADLIMTAGKEVEMPIARLAQLARAVGIHLVIATQRPSVNIITGLIKANFPARVAFKVTAKVDSRTILDTSGADQLIGRGDMLLSIGSDVVRLQCPFVDTPEVEEVVEFIGAQKAPSEPFLLPEYLDEKELQAADDFDGERDVLFPDAARVVVQNQQGSTSLIQRRLKLGYNRAGRLMDQLEAAGIVGPNLGSKARDVLVNDEMELERLLEEEA